MRLVWALLALMVLPNGTWAMADDPFANASPLVQEGRQALKDNNTAVAMAKFKAAAEAGDADAQSLLGTFYLEGHDGFPVDYDQAFYWSKQAADQGASMAAVNLGKIYLNGFGRAADPEKALGYLTKARAAGNFKAGRFIGLYYSEKGEDEKAVTYFKEAAEEGDITSQYYLGEAYELGKGVDQNFDKAFEWYTKAASRGDIIASDGMVGLGSLYEKGEGREKDLTKARALYQKAADLGNDKGAAALASLDKSE